MYSSLLYLVKCSKIYFIYFLNWVVGGHWLLMLLVLLNVLFCRSIEILLLARSVGVKALLQG
jgi:hypothetical protein